MHPAPSVIAFTTLSGAGFGLLFWLGLGFPPVAYWPAFAFYALAFALAVGGLLASTFHLGHPERALLAFTQWRSSWLSREAWAAVLALAVSGLHSVFAIFLGAGPALLGALSGALCLATVLATAMIYAQIRAVPRWHQPATPALFLVVSLAGGATLAGLGKPAALLLLVAGAVQVLVFLRGDTRLSESATTMATATGLAARGTIRAFEPPHTGANYLLDEMVYRVGRRHVRKIRLIGLLLMSVLPAGLLLGATLHPLVSAIAAILHLTGVAALRWLFFAEAEHVVGLYYGRMPHAAA